jgi:hypothetical protein
MLTDVSVEVLAGKPTTFAFKFSSSSFELNVYVPQSQLGRFRHAITAPWESGAVQIGESAGALVFWCAGEPGTVTVMIGRDDQTWDFSVQLPETAIYAALHRAASCTPSAGQA